MKLSIIIPVYNEKDTIKELIKKVKEVKILGVKKELIIVDDGSKDGTQKILKKIKGVKTIFHNTNKGKGKSIKTGLKYATGDIFLIQDADLEYNPQEYPKLIEPFIKEKAKVVYGSRIKNKKNKKSSLLFFLGGIFITKITNLLYFSKLTDEPTCYKVFHKELKKILLGAEGNRFNWEPEITAKILRKKYKIYEVPNSNNPRTKKTVKKLGIGDGISAIITIIKWRFKKFN